MKRRLLYMLYTLLSIPEIYIWGVVWFFTGKFKPYFFNKIGEMILNDLRKQDKIKQNENNKNESS